MVGVALLAFVSAAAAKTITLGSTDANDACGVKAANAWVGTVYTLSETATTQTFSIYLKGGTASGQLRLVMYEATNGTTYGARAVLGASFTVAAGTAEGWLTVDLPHVTLGPGKYLVAVFSNGPAGTGPELYCKGTGTGAFGTDSFAAPSDPFAGTVTASANEYAMYVTLKTDSDAEGRLPDSAPYCSNVWQDNPFFELLSNPLIFVQPRPGLDRFTEGNWSPFAVLTSSLSPAARDHLGNRVPIDQPPGLLPPNGTYTLVCNLDTGWTPGFRPTGTFTDVSGTPNIPAMYPWVIDGKPIPNNFEIAAAG